MDSKASTSEISNDNLKPENEKFNRKKKGVKKHDDLKEFEENLNVEKEDLVIIKKKGSISSTKSSSKEFKNDNDRKDLNQMKEEMDEQKPSTSKASQLSPKISFKQKFVTSKKLSVEEIQRPFDSFKLSSKRRRSSIPDFSQEECAGTNPALFIWPKKSFKDSLLDQEEYLPSDPIESEIEIDDIESESIPPDDNMVVSESTIMFVHPETSSSASQENVFASEEHQKDGFHISSSDVDDDDDDFVDDASDNSEMSENVFDIFLEEVDAKTGTTIVTPRSSDSETDLLSTSGAELMQETNVDAEVEMLEQPILKLSNAFVDEPLEVILEESKNDKPIISDQNLVQTTSKIPEIFENNLECVETVKEVSLQKPPRPPSKKISINLDTQQPSTCAAETSCALEETLKSNISSESKNCTELYESLPNLESLSLFSSPPILTAPPIPPPPKSMTLQSSKQDMNVSPAAIVNESCLPRILQTLTIWPQQFRPLPGLLVSGASRVSIQIKLDEEDILQTTAVGGNPSRVFSEKATIEIKRPYQYVKLIFIEHTENSETRKIGKLNLRKKDILPINGKDVMLPVQGSPFTRSTVSTVLGEICLNMEPKDANIVSIRVLDYTALIPIPPRRLSTSSTNSTSSFSSPPPFFQTRIHLAICITAYGELVGMMNKITLFDRRSIDPIEFNAKMYTEKCLILGTKNASNDSPTNCGTSNYSNSNAKDFSHVRLNIKIYSDPNYDESSYVGFVRIPLDSETFMPLQKNGGANWYEIKSRMTISQNTTILQQQPSTSSSETSSSNNLTTSQYDNTTFDNNMPSTSSSTLTSTTTITTANVNNYNNNNNGNVTEKVGDLRIRFWYSVEHILALNHYQPLFDILMSSLESKPYDISFTSILQHLPVDLGHLARPLMKIFLKHDLFNDFFRLVCLQYVSSSNETSTLFRNQSMASKLMHEMMKFCGSEYLISTLKPVIDLVYAEKKRCEIDPTKLNQGENLEENTRNFAVYAELAFVRVCESSGSCPPLLKNVLNVLREVVNEKYPNKPDISRLAVSSFIIMRFFAAAILNPTQYGLKRKAPDPDVSRTLVLISKILQRLANCVVTQQPLITKEPWLSSVLERFFDDGHRAEMVEFFDSISINNYHLMKSTSSQNRKPEVLKSGLMVEKRGNGSRRRSIKDVFSQKRRFVTLTQKELSWKKEKSSSQNDVEQKGVIPLSEITSVTQVDSQKSSFRVATSHQEIHFQAVNNTDMTDWMILLITHQRRHLFFHNRPCGKSKNMHHHIDIEKELETLHSLLFENIESIYKWKESVEMFDIKSNVFPGDKFPNIAFLRTKNIDERKNLQENLLKTITTLLAAIQQIENVHQTAMALAIQMQNLQSTKPEKLGLTGLSDNENYLLMRGREHRLKSKAVSPT